MGTDHNSKADVLRPAAVVLTLSEIVARLGGEAVGEAAAPLTGVGTLDTLGLVTLSAANTFTGGVVMGVASVLALQNAHAAGSGGIHMTTGDKLVVYPGDAPANTIFGFADSDNTLVDLRGIGLAKQHSRGCEKTVSQRF